MGGGLVIAFEAVLTSTDGNIVESLSFGYRFTYDTGLRTKLPDRIVLDKRIFAIDETTEDEHGRVAYYAELQ